MEEDRRSSERHFVPPESYQKRKTFIIQIWKLIQVSSFNDEFLKKDKKKNMPNKLLIPLTKKV